MTQVPAFRPASRITGSGEMADRIRAFPWQDHSLGPIAGWPAELTVAVNMALSTPEMAAVYWGPEMILLYNDSYLPHLTDKHPALGKPFWDVWGEAREQVGKLMESPYRSGKTFVTAPVPLDLLRDGKVEQTFYSMTGSPVFLAEAMDRDEDPDLTPKLSPEVNRGPKVGGVYLTLSDQTANVRRAEHLAAIEARAGRVLASIGDAVIVTDAEGRITAMNGVAEQLTRWTEKDGKGRSAEQVFRIVNEETRAVVDCPVTAVRRTGLVEGLASHTVLIGKDERETYIDDSAAPIRNDAGELIGVVLVFRDIGERRAVERERALAMAREQLRLRLADAQREALDEKAILQIAAETLGRHLDVGRVGFSEPAADGESMRFEIGWVQGGLELLSGSVPMDHWSEVTSVDFRQGQTVVYRDVRTEAKLGTALENYEEIGAIAVVAVPFLRRGVWRGSLYVNDPKPRQWTPQEIGLIEEVAYRTAEAVELAQSETELRALANRLLLEHEHQRLALDATEASAFNWDLAANVVRWGGRPPLGREAAQLSDPAVVLGFVHPEDRLRMQETMQRAIAEKTSYLAEYRAFWPDDSVHWIRSSAVVLADDTGKAIRLLGVDLDITSQKQVEAALVQTEKLAAVGRLASTMAHEINNPLEAITNLLYLARQSEDLDEARPFLETADAELRRAAKITNQALRFHRQSSRPTLSSFQSLTHDLFAGRHSRLANAGATTAVRDRTSEPVLCFESEVRQVLNNLVVNAIDALSAGGGKLLLRGRDAKDWSSGREGMVITVADTGSGMSQTTQKKLFDAFFTTKGVSGTGLGLWVSREIVERHAGRVSLRSSERAGHRGTVFTVFLPYEAAVREGVDVG